MTAYYRVYDSRANKNYMRELILATLNCPAKPYNVNCIYKKRLWNKSKTDIVRLLAALFGKSHS